MSQGVLIFEDMKVGVLPGDLTVEIDESGAPNAKLILSTAYNVLPLWLRVANDQLSHAKRAAESLTENWGTSDDSNRELLVAELEPSLQVFVACGITIDALYDQLKPFAKLSAADIEAWKNNGTGRGKQITEVVRRVYKLGAEPTAQFKQNIEEIIKFRDMAVHPSLDLKRTCTRPDVPVGVDWKFSAYKYSNAARCMQATMEMLIYLFERKSGTAEVDQQMETVIKALEQLRVVTRGQPPVNRNLSEGMPNNAMQATCEDARA
jgi:hypothetical protein